MFYPLVALFTAILPLHRTGELPQPKYVDLDPRAIRLAAFFDRYQCPAPYYVGDYLRAADSSGIDYRLLPAISVSESTCGQHSSVNNYWGWDNLQTTFESVPHGIHFIAQELSGGRWYRGKTLKQKLEAYNPDPKYARSVQRLMHEIE